MVVFFNVFFWFHAQTCHRTPATHTLLFLQLSKNRVTCLTQELSKAQQHTQVLVSRLPKHSVSHANIFSAWRRELKTVFFISMHQVWGRCFQDRTSTTTSPQWAILHSNLILAHSTGGGGQRNIDTSHTNILPHPCHLYLPAEAYAVDAARLFLEGTCIHQRGALSTHWLLRRLHEANWQVDVWPMSYYVPYSRPNVAL